MRLRWAFGRLQRREHGEQLPSPIVKAAQFSRGIGNKIVWTSGPLSNTVAPGTISSLCDCVTYTRATISLERKAKLRDGGAEEVSQQARHGFVAVLSQFGGLLGLCQRQATLTPCRTPRTWRSHHFRRSCPRAVNTDVRLYGIKLQ